MTVAVDSLASLGAAPPAASEASDNPVAWVARQSAALLGVAGLLQLLSLLLQVCCRSVADLLQVLCWLLRVFRLPLSTKVLALLLVLNYLLQWRWSGLGCS